MKKINLQVKVTYYVDFECEVTEEQLEALECLQDDFPSGISSEDQPDTEESAKAFEWLNEKCNESDAHYWDYEIEDLTEL